MWLNCLLYHDHCNNASIDDWKLTYVFIHMNCSFVLHLKRKWLCRLQELSWTYIKWKFLCIVENYLFSFLSLFLWFRLFGRLQAYFAKARQNGATAAPSNTTAAEYNGSSTVDGWVGRPSRWPWTPFKEHWRSERDWEEIGRGWLRQKIGTNLTVTILLFFIDKVFNHIVNSWDAVVWTNYQS